MCIIFVTFKRPSNYKNITSRVTRLSFMMAAYLPSYIRMDVFASHFECHDNMIRCKVDKFNAPVSRRLERSTRAF